MRGYVARAAEYACKDRDAHDTESERRSDRATEETAGYSRDR